MRIKDYLRVECIPSLVLSPIFNRNMERGIIEYLDD